MDTVIPLGQIQQLLRHTLGAQAEIVDCQVANRQRNYQVLLLQLHRPTLAVVVKLAGPAAEMASSFDRTAMLHRRVAAETDIPMPAILAVDVSCRDWPWRYLIRTHLPGQELAVVRKQMDQEELFDAYRQVGRAAAQLHSIHFPRFGELAADGCVQGEEAYYPAFAHRAQCTIRNTRLLEIFLGLIEKYKSLFLDVCQPSLCHEDLHGHNLLFQKQQGRWRLATILDFDKAWAGHHEIDLARLDFWRGMLSEAFWGAYDPGHRIAPQYPERRPIYQLLWCFEVAWQTPEHLADTQRLCSKLGLPRIEMYTEH